MADHPCKFPACPETFANGLRAGQHYRHAHGPGYRAGPPPPPKPQVTTAAYAPNAVKVPVAVERLPWVQFPRDRGEVATIAASIVEPVEPDHPAIATFWRSLRLHLVALAERNV